VGFGAEAGYVKQYNSNYDPGPILSANALYQFTGTRKLIPFVTGGVSVMLGGNGAEIGAVGGVNVGSGVNYWLGEKLGVRLEFRDHLLNSAHVYGLRIGIVF
jgi:hypothetical protein